MPPGQILGEAGGLPSIYAVDVFATAVVAAATAAVAEHLAVRSGEPPRRFEVHRQHVAAAFRSERYLRPEGWQLPAVWDPIAGDYAAADGWVRIHTNYTHHRDAALRALGAGASRDEVARAVGLRAAEDVEASVVHEGGAAAKLRTQAEWAAHPQGRAVAAEPLVASLSSPIGSGTRSFAEPAAGEAPLAGIRVLDLTRVIAGPVCTRVLAAYGAEVLRIDPPGFAEVPALLPDTTAGKRRAAVDLRSETGREVFQRLVASADLLVCGYRSGALDRLGLGVERLRAWNPGLGVMLLDAYGWSGPWRERRGFDSLVQMTTGIAAPGGEATSPRAPTPLPAQALDHGSGYLLAAAACRALTERCRADVATVSRVSLARVALFLVGLGTDGDPHAPEITNVDPWCERAESSYGPLQRVRCPGRIEGITPRWDWPGGPLGVDAPVWQSAGAGGPVRPD
jgi:hypothetical protein